MSVLKNLEDRGVAKSGQEAVKATGKQKLTKSQLRKMRKTSEDFAKSAMNRDTFNTDDDGVDPYSKPAKRKKSKTATMSNATYQTALLEKILDSNVNSNVVANDIQYKDRVLSYLGEIKDSINSLKPSGSGDDFSDSSDELTKEVSSLAKNLASLNMGGLLKDASKSLRKNADKFGIMDSLETFYSMFKDSIESGSMKDMVREGIQQTMYKTFFGKKGASYINSFKLDPLQTIQSLINQGSVKRGPLGRFLTPFFMGTKLNPMIEKPKKDMTASAVFDNKTHTTINVVLPDLLSRLLATVEGSEQRKYNYEEGKYDTITQLISKLKPSRSKTTFQNEMVDEAREWVEALGEKDSVFRENYIRKTPNGEMKHNANGQVEVKSDDAFVRIMKNVASSKLSLLDVYSGDPLRLINKHDIAKGVKDKNLARSVLSMIQKSMRNVPFDQLMQTSNDLLEDKLDLTKMYADERLADVDPKVYRLFTKMSQGDMTYKEYLEKVRNVNSPNMSFTTGFNNNLKNVKHGSPKSKIKFKLDEELGTIDRLNNRYKNAEKFNPNDHLFGSIPMYKSGDTSEIHGDKKQKDLLEITNNIKTLLDYKVIDKKEEQKILNSPKRKDLIDSQLKRLSTATEVFGVFADNNQTASDMANKYGDSVGTWLGKGYFNSPSDLIRFVKPNGDMDYASLEKYNSSFTEKYMAEIRAQAKIYNEGQKLDIGDPMKSANLVMDSIFTDPALVKKLGIGTGTATGFALGKLINNKTFIKSPKLAYLLGAVGAGVMSMERTQNLLSETLGPGGVNTDTGVKNRDILLAKLVTKWLPSVGLGGKTAGMTMKLFSRFGLAGKLVGLPASLITGLTAGVVAPKLVEYVNEKLFDKDPDNKGIMKKIGRAMVDNIPGLRKFIGGSDRRDDLEVLSDTVNSEYQDAVDKFDELENKRSSGKKLTSEEKQDLKEALEYKKALSQKRKDLLIAQRNEDGTQRDELLKVHSANLNPKLFNKYNENLSQRDNKNEMRGLSNESFSIKTADERSVAYAEERIKELKDKEYMSKDETLELSRLNRVVSEDGVDDVIQDLIDEYIENHREELDDIAEETRDGDSIEDYIISSKLTGYDSENGRVKGLAELSSKEEFNTWYKSLSADEKKYVDEYKTKRKTLNNIKNELRAVMEIKVAGRYGKNLNKGLKERNTDLLIKQAMANNHNIGPMLGMKTKKKLNDLVNKSLKLFDAGGLDEDTAMFHTDMINKLDSFISGGKGTSDKPNSLIKMKDLKRVKFKNGASLSVTGCSVVAMNNALNFLGLGGIDIPELVDIANTYLSSDGGVTSDFIKDIANRLSLGFKVFNTIDNNINNDLLSTFKPGPDKAVILLLRNQNGGSHYVNLRTINKRKAMIDDPEVNGMSDVTTSTLVSSLLEIIELKTISLSSPSGQTTNVTDNKGIISKISDSVGRIKNDISNSMAGGKRVVTPNDINAVEKSKLEPKDSVVNVRIVDDLTLPLKVGDEAAARAISTKLRSSLKDPQAKEFALQYDRLRKRRSVGNEFQDKQDVQDSIRDIANILKSGGSTGFGGAGTGKEPNMETPPEEGSTIGNIVKKTVFSSLTGLLPTALLGGGLGLHTFREAKDAWRSFRELKDKKNREARFDENGNVTKAGAIADRSGAFNVFRQQTRNTIGIANTTKHFLKSGIQNSSKTVKAVLFKAPVKIVKEGFKAFKGGFKGSNIAKVVKDAYRADKSTVSAYRAAKECADDALKMIAKIPEKCPGFIKGPLESFLKSKTGMKLMGMFKKVTSEVVSNLKKSEKINRGLTLGKGVTKTGKFIPFLGIALVTGSLVYSAIEGWRGASALMNKKPEDVSLKDRVLSALAKAFYDCIPDLVAALVSTAFPGVGGGLAAIIASVLSLYLLKKYSSVEGFFKALHLRHLTKDEEIAQEKEVAELNNRLEDQKNVLVNFQSNRDPLQADLDAYNKGAVKNGLKKLEMNEYKEKRLEVKKDLNITGDYNKAIVAKEGMKSNVYRDFVKRNSHYLKNPMGKGNVVITSAFGRRPQFGNRMHNGVDFRAKVGEPVYAIKDGVVDVINNGDVRGGKIVIVRHPDGTQSRYMHLSEFGVKKGDNVNKGDLVAYTGKTATKYPHLHFEMLSKAGAHLDPMLELGIPATALKTKPAVSNPENIQWLNNHKDYIDNGIKSLAKTKVANETSPTLNNAKGGPELSKYGTPVVNTTNNYDKHISINSDPSSINQDLIKMNKAMINSMNQVAELLKVIAKNTSEKSNNNMNEALNLSI